MNSEIVPGATLEVMPPAGHFCLRDKDAPIVLFGGGSGITPIISLIKTALEMTNRSLWLLYANRNDQSIIFKDELAELLTRHPDRLEVVHRLDDVHGFVDSGQVVQHVGPRKDADFYICGPGPFMDVVENGLGSLGVESEQIFIERFESPDLAEPLAPVDTRGGNVVTIQLDGKETKVEIGEGETILAAARRAGLEAPFACEEAYCGCCMAKVAEGEVDMLMNDGGIDQRQIDEGWILTCQGVVKANARIEYPD